MGVVAVTLCGIAQQSGIAARYAATGMPNTAAAVGAEALDDPRLQACGLTVRPSTNSCYRNVISVFLECGLQVLQSEVQLIGWLRQAARTWWCSCGRWRCCGGSCRRCGTGHAVQLP